MKNKTQYPLAVDLDGTLIHTDLFVESFLIYIGSNPFRFFQLVYWFVKKGRAYLKLQLAKRVSLKLPCLPWREDVISWLKSEKAKGRVLVLVTGSAQKYANQTEEYLNLFSYVFGVCRERPRLTGKNKARFLFSLYGWKKFDYIANSFIDYPVWRLAQNSLLSYAYPFVVWKAKKLFHVTRVFPEKKLWCGSVKKNWMHIGKTIINRMPLWGLSGRLLCFFSALFWAGLNFFGQKIHFNGIQLFHGFLAVLCFWISAFIWGELRNLYLDRSAKNYNLFSFLYLYWGVVFIPFFWLGLFYSFVFCEGNLWLGGCVYFTLESVRFLFRVQHYFYEFLVFAALAVWGGFLTEVLFL